MAINVKELPYLNGWLENCQGSGVGSRYLRALGNTISIRVWGKGASMCIVSESYSTSTTRIRHAGCLGVSYRPDGGIKLGTR